jgi:integrase
MGKASKKLSTRAVAAITKPGRHSDGDGLYLNVTATGAKSWLFIWKRNNRPREMGLGSIKGVSLARARELAAQCRAQVAAGLDPIELRDAAKQTKRAAPTFGEMADALIASKEREWRNKKHKAQWAMTLREYCAPLRSKPVDEIDTAAVLAVLTPLWRRAPETASRVRGRVEAVLDAAKAQGHRSGENPAAWRGHLSHLLPKRGKLTRGHHAAMPYAEASAFMARLRQQDAIPALALEFTILTAARSGEVLGARWSEIDSAAKVWTVPAERMKAGREHRVPLCERALAILERLSEARTGELVFPGQRVGRPLSGAALNLILRAMGAAVTVHGFRSAFRDWCGNETHFPREIVGVKMPMP